MASEKQAKLNLSDSDSHNFPLLNSSVGPDVVDIRSLLSKTGHFTYDPGFLSTASCRSSITYIDGDKGELLYRGYPIDQLATHCDFLEVCYLLLFGELPNEDQNDNFVSTITRHTMVHDQIINFFRGFRRDAHPMAVLVGTVGALSAFYHDALDLSDEEHRQNSAFRLIAKMPTITAMAFKYSLGQPFMYPKNELSYSANFMRMMFALPTENYKVNPVLVKALDRIFILHADHEQNASTSTVRLAGSSGANPFACIAAGIACLWGPAHGGANEACLNMLEEIGDVSQVGKYIKLAKDKDSGFRLMGFGHRVYKSGDSRVPTMREYFGKVAKIKKDKKFEKIYDIVEKVMIDRKNIHPNVDYPTGPTYHLMGFDTDFFTPIFVISRITGWSAHIMEQHAANKLIRPLSKYSGPKHRKVLQLNQR